jgi:hypothetical protein
MKKNWRDKTGYGEEGRAELYDSPNKNSRPEVKKKGSMREPLAGTTELHLTSARQWEPLGPGRDHGDNVI